MNHTSPQTPVSKIALPIFLALSLNVAAAPYLTAAAVTVNTNNNHRDISSGTYYNTPNSRTIFRNTRNTGGLWLHKGSLVRGLETDYNGIPDGNGGTLYLRAPGSVVRLDGTLNVSGLRDGSGIYLGNGGRVFIDSAYLYQSGNIFANGANGGLVQINVGAATFTRNAKITAMGFGDGNSFTDNGYGGAININASGVVDIQKGAIMDTSGRVVGTYDTNIINIEGGMVNNAGVLRANGITHPDNAAPTGDAKIVADAGLSNPSGLPPADSVDKTSDGGTVRLIATGQSSKDCFDCAVDRSGDTFTATEKAALENRNSALIDNHDGDIINSGTISANGTDGQAVNYYYSEGNYYSESSGGGGGSDYFYDGTYGTNGGNGGSVIIAAQHNVINSGAIEANGGNGIAYNSYALESSPWDDYATDGGNGGTVAITALNNISNTGSIKANGGNAGNLDSTVSVSDTETSHYGGTGASASIYEANSGADGGYGGLIAFGYSTMSNTGIIEANGGNGGKGQSTSASATATSDNLYSEGGSGASSYAYANASAYGGYGGQGGDGGLIVFSGDASPTGTGIVLAQGGQGGQGGDAEADATASAGTDTSYGYNNASSSAYSSAGIGGDGGDAGHILAPDADAFTTDLGTAGKQFYSTLSGAQGDSGTASATATSSLGASGSGYASSGAYNGDDYDSHYDSLYSGSISNSSFVGPLTSEGERYANDIEFTQANELLIHGGNEILLSRSVYGEGLEYDLTSRFDDADVRYIGEGEGESDNINHLVIYGGAGASGASSPLYVDMGNFNGEYSIGLNTLTVLNHGDVVNTGLFVAGVRNLDYYEDPEISPFGGHISMIADGDIINTYGENYYGSGELVTFGQQTGGSQNYAASGSFINDGIIVNIGGYNYDYYNDQASHGGSIIIKAGQDIYNDGSISPGAFETAAGMGGTIQLQAGNDIINDDGYISAAAYSFYGENTSQATGDGGIIDARAGHDILNTGYITADGYGGASYDQNDNLVFAEGNGGYISLRADNVVSNGLPAAVNDCGDCANVDSFVSGNESGAFGYISANGTTEGGQVILAAGGDRSGTGLDRGSVDGKTFTDGTTPGSGTLTDGVDTTQGESVYNFGLISASPYNDNGTSGSVLLAGNKQVGLGNGSIVSSSFYDYFENDYVNASSTISTILSTASDFGTDLTLASGDHVVENLLCTFNGAGPEGNPTHHGHEPKGPDFDIDGLFQSQRPDGTLSSNNPGGDHLISMETPNMFLLQDYTQVTEDLLKGALLAYNAAKDSGKSEADASQVGTHFLVSAGIDAATAQGILQQINDGTLKADAKVISFLTAIANPPAAS